MKAVAIILAVIVIFPNIHLPQSKQFPTIYVSIVSHNEEPLTGQYPDFVKNESAFWEHREAVVKFANMLYEEGVKYNFQSDWNFLLAVNLYDKGTPSTNGKNLIRYLKEDLGFEVDPHAHETTYNYADVAYLIHNLGVTPSNTVGGFIAYPPEDSKIEYFRDLLHGWHFNYTWKAEILWGGSTAGHKNEQTLWASGIWKPKDNENFLVHDDNAPLPHVGGYGRSWKTLEILLQKQQNGELEPDKIYTQTIFVSQNFMLNDEFIEKFREKIRELKPYEEQGLIKWVGLKEVVEIWKNEYGAEPNIYPYVSLEAEIRRPAEGYLYLFGREIFFSGKTIVIGRITVEAIVACDVAIDKVEFYLDNKLMSIDYEKPYEWEWMEHKVGQCRLKIIAKAGALSKEDEIEVIAIK